MQIQTAFKITIRPMIKSSLRLAKDNLKPVIAICWLAFTLYMAKSVSNNFFYISAEIEKWLEDIFANQSLRYVITDFLFITFDSLLFAIIAYGLFRFFIAKDNPVQSREYKRGIPEQKTVFTFQWFFKISKPVLLIFAGYMIINMAFYAVEFGGRVITSYFMEQQMMAHNYDHMTAIGYSHTAFKFLVFLIEEITYAALILIWPAIALGIFKMSKIKELMKAVKGNLLRLALISILIFAPAYLISFIYSAITTWMAYYLDQQSPIWQMVTTMHTITVTLVDVAYIMSFIIYCIFISLLYNTLRDSEKL